jgi:hypothetical protein
MSGEAGAAIDQLPQAVYEQLSEELDAAIATCKGSVNLRISVLLFRSPKKAILR